MSDISYAYKGAEALVALHAEEMRKFYAVWTKARKSQTPLPETDDPCYASYELLMQHLLGAARLYMVWMCKKLELSDPGIAPVPPPEKILEETDQYLEHLLERWDEPLAHIHEEKFHNLEYASSWNVKYCIDAMLEHAVMHPVRHGWQLKRLMQENSAFNPTGN